MRQLSEITAERPAWRESVVAIGLRTPEADKAMNGAARGVYLLAFLIGATALVSFAYRGGMGDSVHGFIRLTLAIAVLHWLIHGLYRLWIENHRVRTHGVTVFLSPTSVAIDTPGSERKEITSQDEIRFASRPHWFGRHEERDERRVGHPVGYEFRDGWEVWCEAGVDVVLVCAVSTEDDARAIVRHLTEEYLFVSRGVASEPFAPRRAEPA